MRRRLIASAVLGVIAAGNVARAETTSGTAELDRCLRRPTLSGVLARTPLPDSVRSFVTATWQWIGLSRRARTRSAQDHFARGDTLYNQGDYEGAIAEFVAAYCDVPHYNVLYNIAQSFERLVRYEQAVAYLERMIKESPAEATTMRERLSFRVQVLKKLPARVTVATVPPRANVMLIGPSGIAAQGRANDAKPLFARSGRYKMRVELPGYEPVTQTIDVQIGQPYSYYFALKPQTGTVDIVSDPPDARIIINERIVALGKHVERMAIGKYLLRVEKDDRTKEIPFEIRDDRITKLSVKLDEKPRSGRMEMLVASAIGGFALGGGAFTTIFGEDTTGASVGGLLGLGIGVVGGYFGVPKNIPVGTSSYIIGSTLIGAVEAGLIAAWISCDNVLQDNGSFDPRCNAELISGAAVAGSVAGLLFGAITAGKLQLSAGDAAVINSGAIWGTVAGSLFWSAFDADPRIAQPMLLAGLNVGLLAGGLLAARSEISRGHAALIDISGLAGMVAGVALVDVVEPGTRSERLPHFALGGLAIGLIAGAYLTRNWDEPEVIPLSSLQPRVSSAIDSEGRSTMTMGMGGSF